VYEEKVSGIIRMERVSYFKCKKTLKIERFSLTKSVNYGIIQK